MSENLKILLALVAFALLLSAGPGFAEPMGFSVADLQTEGTDGC